jgi:hypothetical protein
MYPELYESYYHIYDKSIKFDDGFLNSDEYKQNIKIYQDLLNFAQVQSNKAHPEVSIKYFESYKPYYYHKICCKDWIYEPYLANPKQAILSLLIFAYINLNLHISETCDKRSDKRYIGYNIKTHKYCIITADCEYTTDYVVRSITHVSKQKIYEMGSINKFIS